MDYRDTQYVNADGKGIFANIGKIFVKKDESGKSKLTTGAKVAAGTIAAGALAFGVSKLMKKKGDGGSIVPEQTSETKSSETTTVATTSTMPQKNNFISKRMAMIEKSANRMWKESGTTLSFKDWLNREKSKFINFNGGEASMIINKPLNDTIQQTVSEIKKAAGYKEKPENKTIFGINKNIVIAAGVVVTALIVYKLLKPKK